MGDLSELGALSGMRVTIVLTYRGLWGDLSDDANGAWVTSGAPSGV